MAVMEVMEAERGVVMLRDEQAGQRRDDGQKLLQSTGNRVHQHVDTHVELIAHGKSGGQQHQHQLGLRPPLGVVDGGVAGGGDGGDQAASDRAGGQ